MMSVSSAREPGRDTECCEVYWQEQCHLQKPVSSKGSGSRKVESDLEQEPA